MNVYAVWDVLPFEGNDLCALYRTREMAESAMLGLRVNEPWGNYKVSEHPVEEYPIDPQYVGD